MSSSPSPDQLSILCIDDQAASLAIRKLFLESQGYCVLTAHSGPEGLELLRQRPVDALLLDYRMPGMDGQEVAVIVKREQPELPIIVLSGYVADIPEELRRLAVGFVTKGSPPDQLLELLQAVLGPPSQGGAMPERQFIDQSVRHTSQVREYVKRAREHVARTRKAASDTRRQVAARVARKPRHLGDKNS